MPRLKPIAVSITLLVMIAAAIAAGLAAIPSNEAGAEGGTLNNSSITDLALVPTLNITYFNNYNLSVNVDPGGRTINNVSFVIRPQNAGVTNNSWDFLTNGTPYPDPNVPFTRAATNNSGNTWWFNLLRPDDIYPEIAFIYEINSEPSNSRFWRDSYHLMHFTNQFDMGANTSFFIELYATPKSTPPYSVDLQVFLVGKGFDISEFESGNFADEAWRDHPDVELVGTINEASAYHHEHSAYSKHFIVRLSTNSEGKVGNKGLDISDDFWIIFTTGHQLQNRGWDLKYHAGDNNGTWYKGSGTNFVVQSGRPDAHVHFARELPLQPYNGLNISVSVGYTEGGTDYVFESAPNTFYFNELPNLPPNPSAFTAPAPGTYQGDVTISWLPATDPNNDPLTYKVFLIGDTGEILIDSGLTDTSYVLDTTVYDDGYYDIRVEACDGEFCTGFNLLSNFDESLCEFFRILNGDPEGSGTIGDPYLICNVCDLQAMNLNLSTHYALNNSFDASATSIWNSGAGFMPVGNNSTPFTGSLNGSGYTITGLFINRSATDYVGLFGYMNSGASVSNISLDDADITGKDQVGGIAGRSWSGSAVSNSSVSGNISGTNYVGGLVGYNDGSTVTNSSATGNVSGTDYVGGLAGWSSGSAVAYSSATGNVSGATSVGGLAGYTSGGTVSNSSAAATVNGSGNDIGGLIGLSQNGCAVSNSSATGIVSGASSVGGLVGSNHGPVLNSSASGNVSGTVQYIGGLAGFNYEAAISDSSANGSVSGPTGSYSYCGGLVGYDVRGNISNSSAAGNVSGGNANGGLIAYSTGGNVSGSSATGNLSGNNFAGGLIGISENGTVINCSAAVRVNSSGQEIGGLIGRNSNGVVANCSAAGIVSGAGTGGGLIGSNGNSSVADSYATGNVSITGSTAGGLIGFSHTNSSVSGSYATGTVSGTGTLGGLIGSNEDSPVSDSYATGAVNGSQAGVGGLMGQNVNSTVYNCSASGDVSTGDIDGNSRAGGLVGLNVNDGGAVSNCSTSGSVSATGDYVGGLIGDNWTGGSVSNCSATGSVSGYRYIGGLAGYSNGSVSDSYAAGAVNATGDDAGGLVGKNDPGSTVARCYATGNASSAGGDGVGGLVGENFGPVFGSYASGNASGNAWVGGLVGVNSIGGNVSNAYATGNVSGSNHIGGLVGANWDASSSINISYSIGYVNGSSNAGGLVGTNYGGTVANSFYDTDTSGKSNDGAGATGLNTSEMKSFSTFFNASWDIEKNHVHNINDGYPYLSWQIPGNSPVWYIYDTSVTLNISSTGGGSVITPGEGDHSYNVGEVVSINASPDPCYRFVEWTGTGVDASKVDFPDSASANITMDNDYNVTANFAPDSAFAGGDGSEGNPYLIQNVCALQNMSSDLSAHYALANDIDASATSGWNWNVDHFEGFIPVGNGSGAFTGTFNGSGYTITGLFINRSVDNVGLFGYVNPEWAAVSNVSLVGMNVIGGDYVGGLAGTNYGSVFNCSAAGNVSGSQSVGGLMGYNMGTVSNSSAAANVVGTYMHTGGLVGWNDNSSGYGSISNSSASGDVNGVDNVGGLAGTSNGIIDNSSSTASVDGDDYVGGLIGKNVTGGSVSNSSASGAVSGHAFVGGLAGDNQANSSIYNSHAAGQVNGSSNGTGGFVGLNNGSVSTSYATGNVFGSLFTGGFAGYNDYGVINTSYAIGNASGTSNVGGFVGVNNWGTVNNSFATGNASGTVNSIGGFVGTNYASVSDSYARGNTNGVQYVGGFAGTNSGLSAVIIRSYSTGSASGTSNLGGLVGINGSDIVSDSFWDTETSGLGTSSGGTGVNTSEMKLFSTFYDAEWDLICESTNGDDDIWGLDYSGAGNDGYPFLWWQGLTHDVSFMLNLSSTEGGNVSTPGEGMQGPYNCSESVSIIADPDVGYFFVDWTGNTSTVDDVNDESTTVTMFGDYSITANFTNVMYNLSIASTPGGNVTAPGEGIFPYGSGHVVAINASADPCYYFVNWTGDMGGNISDVNNPNTSITMNGNYSITANFAKIQYTLNTSSTVGGNVSPPGEGTYNCSEIVDIEATADDCYYFVNWTGTGAVAIANTSAASTTINMSANYSITANFAIYQYTLNTSSTIGGNVSVPGEPGPYTYNCSEAVNISATADDCYHFVNWTGTGVVAIANTSAASTTINMSANYSITANFAMTTYDLSIDSTAGGSVTTPGEGTPYDTYNCSEVIDLVATPADDCHYFVNWTGDTATIANTSAASTSITINGSYSITANFAVYEFDLTTSSSAGGNVSTPGEGTYTYNCSEAIDIIATPDDCYHFVNWTGTGVDASKVDDPLSASTFITMDADYDVYANFEIITYTLTYTAGTGGTVTGNTSQTVDCGTNGSEVTAVPNTGFAFLSWSDSSIKNPRTDTNVTGNITVTAGFRYLGGGGGGGGYIPPYGTTTITLNLFDDSSTWAIDTNGVLQEDVDATSPDGKVSIHIPTGTKALDEEGNPLTEINVDPIDYCPGPPDGMTVIASFDFHPDGATFDPAIEITLTYDPDALPEDVDESQIVIAFYNEATGAWEYLSGTVDPDTNTITFSATHFTIFAVMAPGECAPAPTETPTPTPEPTVEPTPTPTIAPTPTPTTAPAPTPAGGDDGLDKWLLALIIAVGGALMAGLVGAIMIRMRKK